MLDCIAIAYDKDGQEVGARLGHARWNDQGSSLRDGDEHGIPAQQEMTLPPGAYNLRLGVMDRPSQQIGTLDVPLVVPETRTAKK